MQEYRTRLIADVVTDKLDVRDAAAQLPNETDDQDPMEKGDLLPTALPKATTTPKSRQKPWQSKVR